MNPLVNGRAYDWAQVFVKASQGSMPFFGIKSIKYDDTQEMENNYGAGNMPVSRGYGNYSATASITLTMEEIEKLQQGIPSGRLQDYPEFDVTVSFVHTEQAKIVNHVIRNCKFKNNGRDMNQNDKEFATELELLVSHIDWNDSKILGLGN